MKTTTIQERIARVGQRRQVVIPREILEMLKHLGQIRSYLQQRKNGVLIKPKRKVDPGDNLTLGGSEAPVHKVRLDQTRRVELLAVPSTRSFRFDLSTESHKAASSIPPRLAPAIIPVTYL